MSDRDRPDPPGGDKADSDRRASRYRSDEWKSPRGQRSPKQGAAAESGSPARRRGPRSQAEPEGSRSRGPGGKRSDGRRPGGERRGEERGRSPSGRSSSGRKEGGPRGRHQVRRQVGGQGDHRGQRRSLSDQGGQVETRGDAALASILARAMRASEGDPGQLTHAFHSYPARMHPQIAGVLLDELATGDTRVLDPFCGSGTVLIEARRRGLASTGIDLNPLAIRIAEVKNDVRSAEQRARFERELRAAATRSEERVRERRPVRASLTREQAAWFDGHILKELAGLLEEVREVESRRDRRALEVLFSAILQKFSRQESDTAQREVPRQLRKGLVTEFFVRKGEELLQRWVELERAVPEGSPRPRLLEGDARDLPELLEDQKNATLIISSPPYGGTYDYVDHHAQRLAWFEMNTRNFELGEIGARRRLQGERGAHRWDGEMRKVLQSMSGVLSSRGKIVLLIGDAQLGPQRIAADEQLRRLVPEFGLRVEATAAQRRRDWTGRGGRREHLVMLGIDRRPSSKAP